MKVASAVDHPASLERILQQRADLAAQARSFFTALGFLEVETPCLSRDCVVERHLTPWVAAPLTSAIDPLRMSSPERYFLRNSPEFHLKRLLTQGFKAIFEFARSFRGDEAGTLHNPEFTMLEWYRVGDDYLAGMQLLEELVCRLLRRDKPRRLTYRQAFEDRLQLNPHTASLSKLRTVVAAQRDAAGLDVDQMDADACLNFLLASCIEPGLGTGIPVLLHDYPASQAALACTRTLPPDLSEGGQGATVSIAERYELYVDGVELANGYHELLDPAELRRRNEVVNQERNKGGLPELPNESRLLQAMERGLPPCSGVALGFDRLVMLALGKNSLADVQAFPWDVA